MLISRLVVSEQRALQRLLNIVVRYDQRLLIVRFWLSDYRQLQSIKRRTRVARAVIGDLFQLLVRYLSVIATETSLTVIQGTPHYRNQVFNRQRLRDKNF